MSEVYVSIGSNVDRETNTQKAVAIMRDVFGEMRLSPVYQSAAVGFSGDDFLNLVAGFETDNPVAEVVANMRQIEDDLGRDRSQPRFSTRSIDLDILLYDYLILDQAGISIPRKEILRSAHVLKPLQDLIATNLHPVTGQSYGQLWLDMADQAPRLDVVELTFD